MEDTKKTYDATFKLVIIVKPLNNKHSIISGRNIVLCRETVPLSEFEEQATPLIPRLNLLRTIVCGRLIRISDFMLTHSEPTQDEAKLAKINERLMDFLGAVG